MRVLIIQAEMKHYRIPFFTRLCVALQMDGIALIVAYSNSNAAHASRKDRAELPVPLGVRLPGRWFFGRFLYQSLWKQIFAADLVIIGPEAKYLLNPALLLLSALGLKKVAFWGIGPNRLPGNSPFSEWVKQHFFTCVDWWFAYTDSTGEYLRQKGMPPDRITNVQNATDSAELARQIADIPDEEMRVTKLQLTGSPDAQIGLYCGLIGKIKSIPMLLDAARLVKAICPDFHLVLIGNGPERSWLEKSVAQEPWIHYLGSLYGRESALYYKMANVFLLAGTAGLAVVDSFAAGLPVLATDLPTHPPEISYVQDGKNGRLAPHEATAFANAIIEVLSSPTLLKELREGAREAGCTYTIEAMVENFRVGIRKCLGRRAHDPCPAEECERA
jgi:glycosyltransferase involved in cell wall biosynthesis